MDLSVFGKRLKEARTEKKISQKELSALAGVSTVMISSYERSDEKGGNPSLANAAAIANALNVSLDWLCGIEKEKDTEQKIDTYSFLLSYLQFFRLVNDKAAKNLTKDLENPYYGISIEVYKPIIGAKKSKHLYHFTKDILEVLPVLRKNALPVEIQKMIIQKIISDYKDIPLEQLLADGVMIEGR